MLRKCGHEVATSFIQERQLTLEGIKKFFQQPTHTEKEAFISLPRGYQRLYLNRFNKYHGVGWNYLKKRGFTENDLLRYNVMYNFSDRRVLFPSYDMNFKLNYFLSRAIDEDEYIKYQNADVKKTEIVFNEHLIDWSKDLYLVEGVFDGILSRKNAVPILGSSLTTGDHLFHRIAFHDTNIILCLDADAQDKQTKIAQVLQDNGIRVKHFRWNNKDEEKDIADIGSKFLDFGSISNHNFKDSLIAKIRTSKGSLCQPSIV
jgi:hypothetical protein